MSIKVQTSVKNMGDVEPEHIRRLSIDNPISKNSAAGMPKVYCKTIK